MAAASLENVIETADHCTAMTAAAAQRAIASGEMQASDYLCALLGRIEREDAYYHAFARLWPETAMRRAQILDRRRSSGERPGPLHGLPFAVKDMIELRGKVSEAQSAVAGTRARTTAPAVARLERLGAVCVGTLRMEEFGIGVHAEDDPVERPVNPWDSRRTTGGSSSGSAVAVAARLVPFALGADTAGSVRAPAAFCGITGLKPTDGLVSKCGLLPLASTLDTIGPMARTAEDCALLLEGLTSLHKYRPPAAATIGLVDIGPRLSELVRPDVAVAMERALQVFGQLQFMIGDAGPLPLAEMRRAGATIRGLESYTVHRKCLARHGTRYRPTTRKRLLEGASLTIAQYRDALARRREFSAQVDRLLEHFDMIALPVTFAPAARLDDPVEMDLADDVTFRIPFSLTGHPAIAFPTGFTATGLPLSMQLVGRKGEDHRLCAAVAHYQEVCRWHEGRPVRIA